MFEFLNITKALAEENRLRILLALERQELVRLSAYRTTRTGTLHGVQACVCSPAGTFGDRS